MNVSKSSCWFATAFVGSSLNAEGFGVEKFDAAMRIWDARQVHTLKRRLHSFRLARRHVRPDYEKCERFLPENPLYAFDVDHDSNLRPDPAEVITI